MTTFEPKNMIGNESPDPLMPAYPQTVQEMDNEHDERMPADDEQPEESTTERDMDTFPGTKKEDEENIPSPQQEKQQH